MASPERKLSHISHIKRIIISCLGEWQDMYTEHDVNITLPEGKSSLRQVRQMFTSAGQENSLSTSCKHCMRTTAGAREHPGYSADATTPWQPCSGPPVVLNETAPQTGRLPSEMVCAQTPPASPPKTFCSAKSQTGRGHAGWTRSVPHHAAAAGQPT